MGKKVFVSYCHKQGEWVWHRLVACLKAGGADVLIDRERFEAGKGVVGQMDATQDDADVHVLVLSQDYLSSKYCRHEMSRAVAGDPEFKRGVVVPVKLDDCPVPDSLRRPNPLLVDMRKDRLAEPWALLLKSCGASLGCSAPAWLKVRDDLVRFLRRNQSVNLVVDGQVAWRALIGHLVDEHLSDFATVDLQDGKTASRHGLVTQILAALGQRSPVPRPPDDLAELGRAIEERRSSRLALTHFDLVLHRSDYDVNLFSALRHLMDARKLVLLVQSRTPFATLLPRDHPLSTVEIATVELKGRT